MMMLLAQALACFSLLFSMVLLWIARRELQLLVKVTPQPLAHALTVVIPARNEPDIATCVAAVLADARADLRVVVVDDRSTDDTAARVQAIADARLSLLQVPAEPPPGVFGKPHALAFADAQVKTDTALFLDADVVLAPGALGGLLAAFDTLTASGVRALSGVPTLETRTAIEALTVPTLVSLVTSRYLPSAVHDARSKTAFLNGQLIVVDMAAYRQVGGFASVSQTVLEDVALAKRFKAGGFALRLADVRACATTRMYENLTDIVAGFSKNAITLMGASAVWAGIAGLWMALLPWATGIAGVTGLVAGDVRGIWVVSCALASVMVAVVARRLAGVAWWPALALPLSYAFACAVLVRAAVRHARHKPVTWKGRSYSSDQVS